MPDLQEMLSDAVVGLPGFFGDMFAQDPSTWSLIAVMMVGIVALSFVGTRRRRRRR